MLAASGRSAFTGINGRGIYKIPCGASSNRASSEKIVSLAQMALD